MLAYLFWHSPADGVAPSAYEEHLSAFHAALARNAPAGFVASDAHAVGWVPLPGEGPAYEDRYLLTDTEALDALEEAAVSGATRPAHDRAAGVAGAGAGGLYRRLQGETTEGVGEVLWLAKPAGTAYEPFLGELRDRIGRGATLWQRRLTLGPGPEFRVEVGGEGAAAWPDSWRGRRVDRRRVWPSAEQRPMRPLPTLLTPRLRLRPFRRADAPRVRKLAGDRDVARDTLRIPHPYPEGAAEAWIGGHPGCWAAGRGLALAVVRREDDLVVGAVGLELSAEGDSAELGYWIGRPYWGRGYATEAARALVSHAFATLSLARVHAHHFGRNPASGRVLAKLGMRHEGTLRRHMEKWGERVDLECYGVLREEFEAPAEVEEGRVEP